jgi:CRP/FNR family transcriptional regulator, cyclic AMP receptor protein
MMIDTDVLLAWGATYKEVAAEEIIFLEGSKCLFYYQLESGSLRWVNIDENGKEFIQNMVEPGECFGELPLFDDEPYAASAIANKPSLILRLHKSTFHQILKEEPAVHFAFSRLLVRRLRFKLSFIRELAHHEPEQCIEMLISHFKQTRTSVCPNCHKLNLTRQQIANMTGLRVETVIRVMKQMAEKGALQIEHGKVYC